MSYYALGLGRSVFPYTEEHDGVLLYMETRAFRLTCQHFPMGHVRLSLARLIIRLTLGTQDTNIGSLFCGEA